jgi:formate dehydrogenase
MRFCSSTLDASNKLAGAAAIYGSQSSTMCPDILNTDYLLVLGGNPKVSRWTLVSAPNDFDVVKSIRHRGGKVRFVNPRQTESSTLETGPTLLIRPGTDVYFLAAVLCEIDRRQTFDEALLTSHGKNIESLRAFIQRYPAKRVAPITGIDEAAIAQVADELVSAKSAAVYMSTGLNMSRQGILCYWLVEMLNLVTGNLGRTGGTYRPNGLFSDCPPAGPIQSIETSVGVIELPDPIGYMGVPLTLLPDLIENGDIRALIVVAGNPLLAAGGEDSLRKAFEKLELMVSLDIYPNATGEMCDYMLPATDWLERPDINLLPNGMQMIPYVQYTDAIDAPAAGRRPESWILSEILQTMGLPSPLDANPDELDGSSSIAGMLSVRQLSIEIMRGASNQTVTFPQEPRNVVFDRCLQHPDRKIDCYPDSFERAGLFERCESIFEEMLSEPPDVLRLITLRTTHMQNSWLANSKRFRQGRQRLNPLHICDEDAKQRGLHDGDTVRVSSEYGSLETQVQIDNDLRRGAVAMSHGYGHRDAYGLRVASERPGVNYNLLTPAGAGVSEPISHMSWLTAVPVRVDRIECDYPLR